jgi:hypothetical protein
MVVRLADEPSYGLPPLPARAQSVAGHFRKVLEFSNVKDRAASEVFGKSIRIEVEADLHRVLAHKGHIMVGDVVVTPVRKADAEWFEGLGLQKFTDLLCSNHGKKLTKNSLCRKFLVGRRMTWDGRTRPPQLTVQW